MGAMEICLPVFLGFLVGPWLGGYWYWEVTGFGFPIQNVVDMDLLSPVAISNRHVDLR